MKWNYICPKCKDWRHVEWADRESKHNCHKTKESYIPPTPAQQTSAYVDTHDWPKEMEKIVVTNKGNKCTVPGCKKNYETLDHRLAYSNDGKTSVDNLFPMCIEHNQSKNNSDYKTWLATIGIK